MENSINVDLSLLPNQPAEDSTATKTNSVSIDLGQLPDQPEQKPLGWLNSVVKHMSYGVLEKMKRTEWAIDIANEIGDSHPPEWYAKRRAEQKASGSRKILPLSEEDKKINLEWQEKFDEKMKEREHAYRSEKGYAGKMVGQMATPFILGHTATASIPQLARFGATMGLLGVAEKYIDIAGMLPEDTHPDVKTAVELAEMGAKLYVAHKAVKGGIKHATTRKATPKENYIIQRGLNSIRNNLKERGIDINKIKKGKGASYTFKDGKKIEMSAGAVDALKGGVIRVPRGTTIKDLPQLGGNAKMGYKDPVDNNPIAVKEAKPIPVKSTGETGIFALPEPERTTAKAQMEAVIRDTGAKAKIELVEEENIVDPSKPENLSVLEKAGFSKEEIANAKEEGSYFRIVGEHSYPKDYTTREQKGSSIKVFSGHTDSTFIHETTHAIEAQGGLVGWKGTPEEHATHMEKLYNEGGWDKVAEFTKGGSRIFVNFQGAKDFEGVDVDSMLGEVNNSIKIISKGGELELSKGTELVSKDSDFTIKANKPIKSSAIPSNVIKFGEKSEVIEGGKYSGYKQNWATADVIAEKMRTGNIKTIKDKDGNIYFIPTGKGSKGMPSYKYSKPLNEGNAKVKAYILDQPAIYTCKNCSSCATSCYAVGSQVQYPAAKLGRFGNLYMFLNHRQQFRKMIVDQLKDNKFSMVRLHASGDIFSQKYLDFLEGIMKEFPDKKFYAYTKVGELDFTGVDKLPNFNRVNSILPDGSKNYGDMAYIKAKAKEFNAMKCPAAMRTGRIQAKIKANKGNKEVIDALRADYKDPAKTIHCANKDYKGMGKKCSLCSEHSNMVFLEHGTPMSSSAKSMVQDVRDTNFMEGIQYSVKKVTPKATTLAQEAKKYKTAERFYNMTGGGKYNLDFIDKLKTSNNGDLVGTVGDFIIGAKTRAELGENVLNTNIFAVRDISKEQDALGAGGQVKTKGQFGNVGDRVILIDNRPSHMATDVINTILEEVAHTKRGYMGREFKPMDLKTMTEAEYESMPHEISGKKFANYLHRIKEDKQQLTDIWNKAQGQYSVRKLEQEAKKYKTAEEFTRSIKQLPVSFLRDKNIITEDHGVGYRTRGNTSRTQEYISKLKKSISKEGIKDPIELYIEKDGNITIVEGTHRLMLAEELGIESVNVVIRGNHHYENHLTDIWNKAQQEAPPQYSIKKVPEPINVVGEDFREAYEAQKDIWIGEKDVRILESRVEKRKFQKELLSAAGTKTYTPSVQKLDKAMQLYIDTKRNPEHLAELYGKLTPEQKEIVDLSQNLPTDVKKIANKISESYRKIGLEAMDEEVIKNVFDNYAARTWDLEGKGSTEKFRKFGTTTRHAKQRKFDTIIEGWSEGYDLKVSGATSNLQILKEEMVKTIENKRFLKALQKMRLIDGSPLVSTNQLEGYVKVDHPSFKAWKYAGEVTEGKVYGRNFFTTEDGMLFERRDLYAPKAQAINLNNILGISALKKVTGPLGEAIKFIDKYNAVTKAWILQSSFFHHLAFLRSYYLGTNHKRWNEMNVINAYQQGVKAIEDLDPLVVLGVRNGLTLGLKQDWEEELIREKSMIGKWLDKNKVVGTTREKILKLRQNHTDFLFGELGAGLKAKAFMIEYRNLSVKHPDLSADEIAKMAANLINDDFGGLNLERLARNPTLQHIFRIFALAPDWTESNIRSMVKVFKKGGDAETEFYRKFWSGIFTKGIIMTILSNILMATLDEDEEGEKGYIDRLWGNYKGIVERATTRRKGDLFPRLERLFDVDITGLYKKLGSKTEERKYFSILGHFTDPIKFLLNPVTSAHHKGSRFYSFAHEFLTGKNWAGKRFTTTPEILGIDKDKGVYKTTRKGRYKKGDPKWGKLKGKTVTWDFASGGPVGYNQLLSFAIAQAKGSMPVQIQNLLAWLAGEMEGLDSIFSSAGFGVKTTYDRAKKNEKKKKKIPKTKAEKIKAFEENTRR